MELTIKELAPYLPYGLKVQHIEPISFLKQRIRIEVLESISDECCTFKSSCDWHFDFEENDCDIKPILYPLDYLTKEITHNGETFVPINELSAYTRQQTENGKSGFEWGIINTFPYKDILQLLEWKFNVFNLPTELFVPITENFNPY